MQPNADMGFPISQSEIMHLMNNTGFLQNRKESVLTFGDQINQLEAPGQLGTFIVVTSPKFYHMIVFKYTLRIVFEYLLCACVCVWQETNTIGYIINVIIYMKRHICVNNIIVLRRRCYGSLVITRLRIRPQTFLASAPQVTIDYAFLLNWWTH